MKHLLILLAAILTVILIGCSKNDSNPVGPDPVPQTPSPVVFKASISLPEIPTGWKMIKNSIGVQIMKGDGTDYQFEIPNGAGPRTFTGDSAKLFAGKYTLMGGIVWVVKIADTTVWKSIGYNPPSVIISSSVTIPDTNKAYFVATIVD
jgi:hypothetical protein